jgi:hypothetical protein
MYFLFFCHQMYFLFFCHQMYFLFFCHQMYFLFFVTKCTSYSFVTKCTSTYMYILSFSMAKHLNTITIIIINPNSIFCNTTW